MTHSLVSIFVSVYFLNFLRDFCDLYKVLIWELKAQLTCFHFVGLPKGRMWWKEIHSRKNRFLAIVLGINEMKSEHSFLSLISALLSHLYKSKMGLSQSWVVPNLSSTWTQLQLTNLIKKGKEGKVSRIFPSQDGFALFVLPIWVMEKSFVRNKKKVTIWRRGINHLNNNEMIYVFRQWVKFRAKNVSHH